MSTTPASTVPDHPALQSALITYLGNKRALLPFLWTGIQQLAAELGGISTLADPFHGSGVVSRMARLAGLNVTAGDIEAYTRPFGVAFLETDPDEVEALFAPWGGYPAVLRELNALQVPAPEDAYFSRHYAPKRTETADPARERLFFTRENAERIDAMLAAIHRGSWRQPNARGLSTVADNRDEALRRDILLASLLVEMSVHNNTSGVMKGFHHGWGGRGGDALGRIMAPVELEPLPLISGPRGRMHIGPATELPPPTSGGTFDIAYLDPPYTIHQYGANYHLLTSAVRWDFYDPGPVAHGRRAGIRSDHYRSDHCRRSGARAYHALAAVLDSLDTRSLLVSYNSDGIIAPDTMLDILSEDGLNTVRLLSTRYHKFRGGKATQAAIATRELLFTVVRGRRQSRRDRDRLRGEIEQLTAERDLHARFLIPARWDHAWSSAAGSAGTTTLRGPDGETVAVDRELRVTAVYLPDDPVAAARARRRIEAASGDSVAAAEALVASGDTDTALRVLKRLKIRKYRSAFDRLAETLDRRDLTERQRSTLEELRRRVRGDTAPADRPR